MKTKRVIFSFIRLLAVIFWLYPLRAQAPKVTLEPKLEERRKECLRHLTPLWLSYIKRHASERQRTPEKILPPEESVKVVYTLMYPYLLHEAESCRIETVIAAVGSSTLRNYDYYDAAEGVSEEAAAIRFREFFYDLASFTLRNGCTNYPAENRDEDMAVFQAAMRAF